MRTFIFLAISLLICQTNSATSYFVSTNGNDQNPGTIFYTFKTIQKAIDVAQAGDEIVVLPGIYSQKIIIVNKKGTVDKPIKIMANGDVTIVSPTEIMRKEPKAMIQGKEENIVDGLHPFYPFYRGGVIRVEYSSNIIIEGFRIINSPWMGISALECDNLTILNNTIDNTMASGIYIVWSRNVITNYNEITRACGYPTRVSDGGPQGHGTQEFLSIVSCKGFEVAYNRVHETNVYSWTEGGGTGSGGEGIDVKEHSSDGSIHHNYVYNLVRSAIYCDAWNALDYKNIDVYNNVVHDCLSGLGVGAEDGGIASNIRFFNNLVFNATWDGFSLASWGPNGEKKNIHIFNNIFHNCGLGGIQLGDERHDSIFVYNNICLENGRESSRHGSMEKPDLDPGNATNVFEKGNIFSEDPGFVDMSRYDYRLKKDSKAIDAGVAVETFGLDLDNNPRIVGKSIDIGPFEYQGK